MEFINREQGRKNEIFKGSRKHVTLTPRSFSVSYSSVGRCNVLGLLPEVSLVCSVFYMLAYRFVHFCRGVNMPSVENLKQKKNQYNDSAMSFHVSFHLTL